MALATVTESNLDKQVYDNISEILLTNSFKVDIVPTFSINMKVPIIHVKVDTSPDSRRFGNSASKFTCLVNVDTVAGTVASAKDIAQECINLIKSNEYVLQGYNMSLMDYKTFTRTQETNSNRLHIKSTVFQFYIE